jgi:GTP-binding protein Era
METHSNFPYKSGFVAVMGRPNVGKSTLVNALLGQKVAAVSLRPQTTRKRQLGILTLENAQVIFIDTPGLHQSRHKLGEKMNQEAREALDDSDVILFLVDAGEDPQVEDRLLANVLKNIKMAVPILLVVNKADLLPDDELPARTEAFKDLVSPLRERMGRLEMIFVSATRGDKLTELLSQIITWLPENEPYYPEDQITDYYEREIAADLIREAALIQLRDEVPHGIAVRMDEYIERNERGAYISATIFVERESHKSIVIGKGGEMLKKIGSTARQEIEAMSGRKVFLRLRVKVSRNWRNDENALRLLGFGR